MTFTPFAQSSRAVGPRVSRRNPFSTTAAAQGAAPAQDTTSPNSLHENELHCFPQIHSPSLQYIRHLFPLRNE
jgi:hypothetical protein